YWIRYTKPIHETRTKQKQVKVANPTKDYKAKAAKKNQRLQSKSGKKKTNCKAKAKITKQEYMDKLNTYNELEIFAAYKSVDDADDLSDNDDLDSNEELSVGHGIRIGEGGRVNSETQEIIKRTYVCRHSGKPQSDRTSCRVGCPWQVNIWAKKDKNCLEVTTFNNEHVGHKLNPLASHFDPTL
ncbi:9791_t:CDS:2, partial [Gigaspora rosea]